MSMHLLHRFLAEGRLVTTTSCVSRWRELDASVHMGQVCTDIPSNRLVQQHRGWWWRPSAHQKRSIFWAQRGNDPWHCILSSICPGVALQSSPNCRSKGQACFTHHDLPSTQELPRSFSAERLVEELLQHGIKQCFIFSKTLSLPILFSQFLGIDSSICPVQMGQEKHSVGWEGRVKRLQSSDWSRGNKENPRHD